MLFRSVPAIRASVKALFDLFAKGQPSAAALKALTTSDFLMSDGSADDWSAAMQWIRAQPSDWLVLADPDHAWKYGTSVRVAASRDVVLEVVKDSAISLYSRDVALRTVERTRALADFAGMHTDTALRVARQYGVTALVVESVHVLALPKL